MTGTSAATARVDVIVPVHNQLHVVRPCLESVARWTDPELDRVTLVADACDAGTLDFLEEWASNWTSAVVVQTTHNYGFVRGCNLGLKRSRAAYCVLLNSDTCVTPRWADKLVMCMESDPTIGVVSPLTNFSPHMRINMLPGFDYLEMNALVEAAWDGDYPDVTTPEGFCFMISRRCLASVGYLDEAYDDGYGEESDFALRANYFGFRTVCATNTYIYHRGRASYGNERRESLYRSSRRIFHDRWREKYPLQVEEFRRRDPVSLVRRRLAEALEPNTESAFKRPDAFSVQSEGRSDGVPGAHVGRHCDHAIDARAQDHLNILFVLPTLNPYGGVISVTGHVNHMIDRGHRVTLASLSRISRDRLFPKTEPVYLQRGEKITNLVADDYDVLIATSWETVDLVRCLADSMPRAVPVYYVQDIEADFFVDESSDKVNAALETYSKLPYRVVKTQYLEKRLRELGWGAYRIPPGLDLDLFYPRSVDRGQDWALTVLGMARPEAPSDIRGFGTLKKVFEILSRENNEVQLHVFGSDDLPPDFQCHRNLGRVAQDHLPEIYSSAHVFVETSLHHGFGRTGVEAMACGTACVLSDSGGISEYAKDRTNCLIVPKGDPETTARAIQRLLDDELLRRNIVQNGLDTVQRISVRQATDDFLLLLRQLKTRHGNGAATSNALRGQAPGGQAHRGNRL